VLGDGSIGQIGDGFLFSPLVPTATAGLLSGKVVTSIAAGSEPAGNGFTVAVSQGNVFAWGANSHGQLGDGTKITRKTPVQVTGITNPVVTVDVGTIHSVAIDNTGRVWTWGGNSRGQVSFVNSIYLTIKDRR
jgi:alpha-tubulin suppressor-like RCC1 family protein